MTTSFVLFFTILVLIIDAKQDSNSGPYRAMISRVQHCDKPSHPYVKDPPAYLSADVHNVSNKFILNCNLSISRDIKNVKIKLKSYIWANNKWRPNYVMNDIGCNGVLLQYITKVVGVKYDSEKCTFLKGFYKMDNLDVNAVLHIWANKMEYGKIMWKCEVYHLRLGTFYCLDFFTVAEPA